MKKNKFVWLLTLVATITLVFYKKNDYSDVNTTLIEEGSSSSAEKKAVNTGSKSIKNTKVSPIIIKEQPEGITSKALKLYKQLKTENTPESQLKIFMLLKWCNSSPLRKESDFSLHDLPEDVLNEYRVIFEECDSLYALLGEEVDLKELSHAWLQSSADSGYPISKLTSLYEYPDPPLAEEALPLLYESLAISKENLTLKGQVYDLALKYYSDNIEDVKEKVRSGNYARGKERDAWDYLSCKYSKYCDLDAFVELYNQHFYEFEYREMLEHANLITQSIESENWEELGLELNSDESTHGN